MRTAYYTYTITTTAGTGQVLTAALDTVASVMELASIKAVSAVAVYDIYIYDIDDYLIYFDTAITGDSVIILQNI